MKEPKTLTIHPEGSIRELWAISFPLMISTLATLSMIFVDRLFLSKYSLNALNAAAHAGTWAWAYIGGLGVITAMSEVFVSQFNGADIKDRIGVPVWQMIWFSLFSLCFFIPMALWVAPYIYAGSPYQPLEVEYFRILMLFGPAYAWMTALCGFFIGRGQTKLLIWVAITANVINILLDWVLIFGIKGVVPEMGIRGAGIATSVGYLFEGLFLFALFMRYENRKNFGTNRWQFNFPLFRRCLRVGFPQGLFYFLEIMGFALFYQMMTKLSEVHITISSICQSILILLSFFYDGLSRGVVAIAGNFIGGNRHFQIGKVLKSGLILQGIFSFALLLFFVFGFHKNIHILFPGQWEEQAISWGLNLDFSLQEALSVCLFCSFLYITFEGIRWVLSGILTAAGDTLFLLIAGPLSVWLFLLLPVYLIVVQQSSTVEIAWILIVIYSILTCILYAGRLRKGKWKSIQLIE